MAGHGFRRRASSTPSLAPKRSRWRRIARFLVLAAPLLFFFGCSAEQKATTAEERIAEFRRHPSERTKRAAAEALASLSAAIQEREQETMKGNQTPKETASLAKLELKRAQLNLDFAKAKVDAFVNGLQKGSEEK
ncbi:hypothetical protein [Methylacidimicrobium sp. B4]|uniref:hypothetical protein n=1 Tax=Methylacidimicrobium sp. B4 TaxID=2796139 RepID=UPI001A8EBE81|nr:hypothetical protein [Methylacidimicrobium sp. B4]QSR84702.1 hypothetical protein MacB4_11025 [Methylacidimicrobium sp. B4]